MVGLRRGGENARQPRVMGSPVSSPTPKASGNPDRVCHHRACPGDPVLLPDSRASLRPSREGQRSFGTKGTSHHLIPARSPSPILPLPRPNREPAFRESGSSRRGAGPCILWVMARAAAVRTVGPGWDAHLHRQRQRMPGGLRSAAVPKNPRVRRSDRRLSGIRLSFSCFLPDRRRRAASRPS